METSKSHSKIGIAACIAGAAAFLISVGLILLAVNESNILFTILFIALILLLIHFACLILSLAALLFSNRKKLYAIWGAALNFLFLIAALVPWFYFLTSVKLRVL